ncbi:Lpg1974 family pore-forming outer membrane protein [Candidatus Laterigemmans baculatus]|uniref:Lpg1974 family pore-forming outer membrane protein n=1 Tax=Candidatus Laterigemmans baculatus TaxID=2770505 RepID=UPI0013DBC243|nr:Lpg1974 family pore-forming outer membrane protein [Candidatus Laterigemmans baculatus]
MAMRWRFGYLASWLVLACGAAGAAETGPVSETGVAPIPAWIDLSGDPELAVDGGVLQPVGHVAGSRLPAIAECCPEPPWAHRSGLFGELLLLRARDTEVAYALPVNGNVPEGAVGLLDGEFDLGFKAGITRALDESRSLSFAYTGFFSDSSDRVAVDPARSLVKLLVHPNELNAAANVLEAGGESEIDFQTADLAYRFLVLSNHCTAANLSIGARYGRLDQELAVEYSGAGLTETVTSDVEFNGLGLRLGADLEHHGRHGLFCYGKTGVSFLAGEFQADYLHSSNVDPVRVSTSWDAGRILSVLDLEVGAGWQCSPSWRLSAGYTISNWFGAVKTDEWIHRVRNDDLRDMSDNLTFDGFVARAEYRF